MTKSNFPSLNDPELRDLIAAQYVLGTLSASARLNFELKLQEDLVLREITYDWERRLNPLTESLEPISVPSHVWQHIEEQLGITRPIAKQRKHDRFSALTQFWWGVGVSALAASIFLFITMPKHLFTVPESEPGVYAQAVQDVAVLTSEQGGASWIVRRAGGKLLLSALSVEPIPSDKDLELWSVPQDGKPRSLGVLITHNKQVVVLAKDLNLIKQNMTLAISLEPKHGSPTGQPTGKILYSGKIVRG